MNKVVIFGAGTGGENVFHSTIEDEVICFIDNDSQKWGNRLCGIPIHDPQELINIEYDSVILATVSGMEEMKQQLIELGVPSEKIKQSEQIFLSIKAREAFLDKYAEMAYENHWSGSVAEVSVFRGDFAKHINKNFKDRKCYLFDTFAGFVQDDLEYENENVNAGHLAETSIQLVLNKMKYPERIVVKQGWFPQSAEGVNEKFIFINLDMDLYKPTLEGLKFFYPLLNPGGIILLHDYYSQNYPGIKKAVCEFEREIGSKLIKMPIGDNLSIVIINV